MEVDIAEALARLAPKLGGPGAWVQEAQRLTGGASMETWAFAGAHEGVREEMILRRRSVPFDEATSRSTSLATEAALIVAAAEAPACKSRK